MAGVEHVLIYSTEVRDRALGLNMAILVYTSVFAKPRTASQYSTSMRGYQERIIGSTKLQLIPSSSLVAGLGNSCLLCFLVNDRRCAVSDGNVGINVGIQRGLWQGVVNQGANLRHARRTTHHDNFLNIGFGQVQILQQSCQG